MDTQLITVSLVSALLYLVLSARKALSQRRGGSFFTSLLATVTLVSALLALYLPAEPSTEARTAVLGLGAVMAAAGAVLLAIEWRRVDRKLSDSRGILAIGTGVLLFVGLFAGPLIAQAVTPPLPAMSDAASAPAAGAVDDTLALTSANATPEAEIALMETMAPPTASPTAAPTATPLPPRPTLPMPTPTNTPVVIATWAATEEAAVAEENALADCVGFVQNNLNLRAEPDAGAELLVTIPSGTAINIAGTNADGSWLHTTYGQLTGWVSADYVLPGESCNPTSVQTQ